MAPQSIFLFRVLWRVVVLDLSICVVVGLICLLGGRTFHDYGNDLMMAGVAVVVFGVMSVLGGWALTRDAEYLYTRSVAQDGMADRAIRDLADSVQSFAFSLWMILAGILVYILGLGIQNLWG